MSNTKILKLLLMLAGYMVFEEIHLAYGSDSPAKVNCGCHIAESCSECGTQPDMCNGDCVWKGSRCVSKNGVGGITDWLPCTPNPSCDITGCDKGCCLNGMCCPICPKIINPPKEEPCGECSNTLVCPGNCPYCYPGGGIDFGLCHDISGLRDQIQLDVDNEIANLTSSNLAEFQSTNSDCSWWRCAIKVFKAIYHCHKECDGQQDCIVPCAKKVLNSIESCWPCIKRGCCKLKLPCCDVEKEDFISALDGSNDLVIIGGDNNVGLLSSPEIITSSGVCHPGNPRTIPPLKKTTGGGLAWMKSDNITGTLVFCGGSHTYKPGTYPISNYGATSSCYSLKPGSSQWSSVGLCKSDVCGPNHQNDMTSARSWFSLTAVDDGEMFAVGGINNEGIILNTIEKYSVAEHTWKPFQSKLANPKFGHCAVHYKTGGNSYLILIGGSRDVPSNSGWYPSKTVEQIDHDSGIISTLNNLPKGLWRPACTVSNGFIYVSGGATGSQLTTESAVYRYSFSTGTWNQSPIGYLNYPRWGAVMGTTFDGAFGQLIVAGGYDYSTGTYYQSVESSNNGGNTWKIRRPGLNETREYASVAAIKPGTFTCQ